MARSTRSRQTVLPKAETESKINLRKTSTNALVKATGIKTRSNNKKTLQDENAVPLIKNNKTGKNSSKPLVIGSTLHLKNKENSATRRSSVLALKSPVLRDRTNTTTELIKDDLSSQNTSEKQVDKNKKPAKKGPAKKSVKIDLKLSSKAPISIKKYLVEKQRTQKDSEVSKNAKNKNIALTEDNAKENKENSVGNLEFQNSSPRKKVSIKQNISIEELEKLLNEEEESENDDNEKPNVQKQSIDKNGIQTLTNKNNQVSKKFFQNKRAEKDININNTGNKKSTQQKVNSRKKGAKTKKTENDSSFNVKLEEKRKSAMPPEKKLRPRAAKNYCDESQLSQDSNDKESADAENHRKGIPIYKNVRLSQENIKDKEVYEFPEDSQENIQTGKKRKKTTRRPTVKRAKKTKIPQAFTTKKEQKKGVKKVTRNVQFVEPIKEPSNTDRNEKQDIESTSNKQKQSVNTQQIPFEKSVEINFEIPEYFENENDREIKKSAPNIKIISDHDLEGSRRINLTTTPPVPKTITSELKLFGPKNVITSKPTTKYNNMVNHSLIRKSLSPIKKTVEEFDTGSPWRAADAFSRVHKIVQSTPQINRLPLMREKKLPLPTMNLMHKKSISSEDTILLSSNTENKMIPEQENGSETAQKSKTSPRKFGTVISNISPSSPVQASSIKSINSNKSSSENHQSPLKNISEQSTLIVDSKLHESQPIISADTTKLNNSPSPKRSPKKKFSTPSPFRFEKIRSSNRIESQSNLLQSVSNKENEDVELPGPSIVKHSSPAVLKQSNLDNFLNLDEMPKSSRICTPHGIFDDVETTPISGKKGKNVLKELNVENAFGFDEDDTNEELPIVKNTSTPVIATEKDVRNSVKGKIFPNARVKSALPLRISTNTVKKELLKTALKNTKEDEATKILKDINENATFENNDANVDEINESVAEKEHNESDHIQTSNEEEPNKKALLDAVSFSDTFDVYSECGENNESKIPDEIPLFVDTQPLHFSKPPRRSYNKRKKAVYFNTSLDDSCSDEDVHEKAKPKKKKLSKLGKEEQKRMQEWIKSINSTFDEIEHYDLVVE